MAVEFDSVGRLSEGQLEEARQFFSSRIGGYWCEVPEWMEKCGKRGRQWATTLLRPKELAGSGKIGEMVLE